MKYKTMTLAAIVCLAVGTATAQTTGSDFEGPYVVAELGYDNGPGGFDQFIYGAAAGLNFRASEQFYFGVEGEFHGSADGAVDFIYGGHAVAGFILREGTSVFARAGYREFNFDDGFGSDGDYSLGLGTQFGLTDNLSFRSFVDTVAFDTIGVRGGLVWDF